MHVIYTNHDGQLILAGVSPNAEPDYFAKMSVPEGVAYKIIDSADLPSDTLFVDAWTASITDYTGVIINMDKAKAKGHAIRRAMRDAEFAPLDVQIMKQIPGTDTEDIEAQRQAIRDKYAGIQTRIDAAATPEEIKAALGVT